MLKKKLGMHNQKEIWKFTALGQLNPQVHPTSSSSLFQSSLEVQVPPSSVTTCSSIPTLLCYLLTWLNPTPISGFPLCQEVWVSMKKFLMVANWHWWLLLPIDHKSWHWHHCETPLLNLDWPHDSLILINRTW